MFEKIKNAILYDIYGTNLDVDRVSPLMFGFIPMVVMPMTFLLLVITL